MENVRHVTNMIARWRY